jgi:membrane-associated phospholipid phosphatase
MYQHAYTARTLPPAHLFGRTGRRGPMAALAVAALCLAALAVTWIVAEHVPAAQLKDSGLLNHFVLLGRPRVDSVANALLHLLDPLPFILWALVLVAVALVRRRPRVAVAGALVMSLAPLTAETLKPLLAHPHVQIGLTHIAAASWPSGHSTAALALVLCAVLVAPARLRALVTGLGLAFAAAVGCSLLILAWHMPSDVLGGYLVASLWMALAVAGLRATDRRRPSAGP